jgi:hypothetical protein
MKIPVSVAETCGVDLGDNPAAQILIDAMPEELRVRFVAQGGRIIPRDPELRRGAFLVLKHYDKHHGEQREVPLHPAVIEAAAVVPTTGHGQFEPEEFFCVVERIAKQKYAKAG